MVIPIDAFRYGVGFDAAGQWHDAVADYLPDQEREAEAQVMGPARGAVWGLLVSVVLWVGLAGATKTVMMFMR